MTSESMTISIFLRRYAQLINDVYNSPFATSTDDDRKFVATEPLGAPSASSVLVTDPTLPPSAAASSASTSTSSTSTQQQVNPGQTAAELTARAQATLQNTKEYLQSTETKPGLAGNLAPDQSPIPAETAPVS